MGGNWKRRALAKSSPEHTGKAAQPALMHLGEAEVMVLHSQRAA